MHFVRVIVIKFGLQRWPRVPGLNTERVEEDG